MNILTKIGVVILVVLVLLATPIFIRTATTHDRYRLAYESMAARVDTAVGQTTAANAALQAAQYQRMQTDATLVNVRAEAAKEISRLNAERIRLETAQAGLHKDVEKFTDNYAKIQAELKTAQTLQTTWQDSYKQVNSALQTAQTKLTEGETAIKRLEQEVQHKDLTIRSLEEQVAIFRDRVKMLEESVAKASPSAAGAEGGPMTVAATDAKLAGAVTAVSKDIASVNLGQSRGVKQGMVLVISRGSQFVANLRIQTVDADQAAGVITDKQLEPMQGDKVQTAASLRS